MIQEKFAVFLAICIVVSKSDNDCSAIQLGFAVGLWMVGSGCIALQLEVSVHRIRNISFELRTAFINKYTSMQSGKVQFLQNSSAILEDKVFVVRMKDIYSKF